MFELDATSILDVLLHVLLLSFCMLFAKPKQLKLVKPKFPANLSKNSQNP